MKYCLLGMGFVKDIESMETESDKPKKDVVIADCGEIAELDLSASVVEDDGTEDKFPYHPDDLDGTYYLFIFIFSNISFQIPSSYRIFRRGLVP